MGRDKGIDKMCPSSNLASASANSARTGNGKSEISLWHCERGLITKSLVSIIRHNVKRKGLPLHFLASGPLGLPPRFFITTGNFEFIQNIHNFPGLHSVVATLNRFSQRQISQPARAESNGVAPSLPATYFALPDDPRWQLNLNILRKPDWVLSAKDARTFNLVTDLTVPDNLLAE